MAAMRHGDFHGHLTDRITRCVIKISLVYAIAHGVFKEFVKGTKFTDGVGGEYRGTSLNILCPYCTTVLLQKQEDL